MLSRLLLSLARWSLFELRHGHRQEDARTRASSLRPALPISKHMQIARERTGPSSDSDPTVSFSPWSTTVSCKLYSPPLRLLRGIAIQAHAHPTNALVGPSGAASYPSSGTGPLAGLRLAVKDNICTKSLPTTCSSKILENFHSPFDATVVSLLSASGAEIIGKANCDEFGMG